jgi:chloramphenicol-sensitive protein RarD
LKRAAAMRNISESPIALFPYHARPHNCMAMNASSTTPATAPVVSLDRVGLISAAIAFLIWGLLPIFLKQLTEVPVLQVIAHRLVWGYVVAMIWLALRGEVAAIWRALADPQIRWRLCASAALISTNWFVYVWGVANDRVIETSLGYFINPLLNVMLGVLVLSERLNRSQWSAVALAAVGVSYLTWSAGHLPWLALMLASSFGLYGLVRKTVAVEGLIGFGAETLILLPLAAGYLIWCEINGTGAFGHIRTTIDALLLLGGPLTAVPLVLFAVGARRLPYSTVGLLQYIGPTLQLLLGVMVYHEPFDRAKLTGFAIIWTGLAVYGIDSLWRSRKVASEPAA